MKDILKIFIIFISIAGFFTAALAGLLVLASSILQSEIIIQSNSALIWFAAGTFAWIIPLQIIDWMKLIPVQRRMKRILYPHFITFIQLVLFAAYMVGLNMTISEIAFTNLGLIAFTFIVIAISRFIYSYIVRTAKRHARARVRVS